MSYFRQKLCSLINNFSLNASGHSHWLDEAVHIWVPCFKALTNSDLVVKSPIVYCLYNFTKLLSFFFHLASVTLKHSCSQGLAPQSRSERDLLAWLRIIYMQNTNAMTIRHSQNALMEYSPVENR